VSKLRVKIRSVFRCYGRGNGSDIQNFSGFEILKNMMRKQLWILASQLGEYKWRDSKGRLRSKINALNITGYAIRTSMGIHHTFPVKC
jgi:hypothetical protein